MAALQSTSEPVAAEPELSTREKRVWGDIQATMIFYHDRFRSEFDTIYKFADKPERLQMNLPSFLRYAKSLHSHLNAHHGIEERYIFPILAKKMPEFKNEHIDEHKKIHDGLDRYSEFLNRFSSKTSLSEYDPEELRAVMDSFKEVLFYHLDAEVHSLRAENMKKYWTEAELREIPM